MITTIKASNVDAFNLLFEEATNILSGYKEVRTYSPNTQYYYKKSGANKGYVPFEFSIEEGADSELVQFANALAEDCKMYIKVKDEPVGGFSPELGITTLEEYYNWLPDLKSVTVEENGVQVVKPTKFTVLPLDEEHFKINANTRAINIPADFKKNGVAVQGDDLAEIVYFEIDRYFDAVDLNNCDIYIQWEAPKDSNGDIKKGTSDTYIRDIESQPGKLIFGWAISEAITNASGNLKFSVKFLQRDKESKKIVYNGFI